MAKRRSEPNETEPELTFEQSLEQLEQVVRRLEEGQLGLSESLVFYEDGIKHLKRCYQALKNAERKIELLAGIDAAGNPIAEPFDEESLSLEEKANARGQRRSRPAPESRPSRNPAQDDIDEPGGLF